MSICQPLSCPQSNAVLPTGQQCYNALFYLLQLITTVNNTQTCTNHSLTNPGMYTAKEFHLRMLISVSVGQLNVSKLIQTGVWITGWR